MMERERGVWAGYRTGEGFEVNSLDFCRELGNGDRGSEMRQSISLNSFPASLPRPGGCGGRYGCRVLLPWPDEKLISNYQSPHFSPILITAIEEKERCGFFLSFFLSSSFFLPCGGRSSLAIRSGRFLFLDDSQTVDGRPYDRDCC